MSNMNDNAKLYVQHLTYKKGLPPYLCLTLPWWVRTPYPTYGPRHGCSIEPLICGERVFGELAGDIHNAKHSVDIITWGFDPGMVLVRGAAAHMGQRYGDLLKEIATRKEHPVTVRLLVWHDDVLSEGQMKNIPGYYGALFPCVGSSEGGFYSESHQTYNAEWFDQVRAGKYPNIEFYVRSVPSVYWGSSMEGEDPAWSVKSVAAQLYATHHQKMVLIDYEMPKIALGYVMGHNSISDFWDTEAHLFRDPRRETYYKKAPADAWKEGAYYAPGAPNYKMSEYEIAAKEYAVESYLKRHRYVTKPYQDVSCRLRGPILSDLNHNFCQAWGESNPAHAWVKKLIPSPHAPIPTEKPPVRGIAEQAVDALNEAAHNIFDQEFILRRHKIGWRAFSLPSGQHSVQLMRTQPLHREKAIKECYANLARQTHHYMFIQNQYIQYEPWAMHLKECVKRLRDGGYKQQIYIFLLTSTPERAGMDLPTYDVASELGQSATMVKEHAKAVERAQMGKQKFPLTVEEMAEQGISLLMGSMWTCAKKDAKEMSKDDYEEIYIHAKVAIVDDAAFTLGSANLNLRSMVFDSELNVLSEAKDVAYQLRADLFKQCTGDPGPKQFGDMAETLKRWKDMMKKNLGNKDSNGPLISQLMPFHVDREPGSPVV